MAILLRFCFERGHIVKATAKGDYGKLGTFTPRPHCEFLWPESAVTLSVPDWNSFRAIWKRRCPKIKIRNICEDTCPECYILKNKFRYLGRKVAEDNDLLLSSSSVDEDDASSPSHSDADSDKENYRDEQLIAEATNHAEEAQQQRSLAQARQQTAMEEVNFPHEDRRFVLFFFV